MAYEEMGALVERARERLDEMEAEEAARERQRQESEDPKEKMMREVAKALELRPDPRKAVVDEDIKLKIGTMFMAEPKKDPLDNSEESEPKMAIVVLEDGTALGGSKVKMPLTELGVSQVLFVSRGSRLGGELLTNEEALKKAIIEEGIGKLSFSNKTGRDSTAVEISWTVTALYDPDRTKEIILGHLEEIAV
jgi:hypothetical protein